MTARVQRPKSSNMEIRSLTAPNHLSIRSQRPLHISTTQDLSTRERTGLMLPLGAQGSAHQGQVRARLPIKRIMLAEIVLCRIYLRRANSMKEIDHAAESGKPFQLSQLVWEVRYSLVYMRRRRRKKKLEKLPHRARVGQGLSVKHIRTTLL